MAKPIKWAAATEQRRYADVLSKLRVQRLAETDNDWVLVHEGDMHVPGELRIDYRHGPFKTGDSSVVGLWVRGNLRVDGCLVNYDGAARGGHKVARPRTARNLLQPDLQVAESIVRFAKAAACRCERTPMTKVHPKHPNIKVPKENINWPIEHVRRFWLKVPSYDSRANATAAKSSRSVW